MRINSNISAQQAVRQVGNAHDGLAKSLERISTGRRINSASDDASGMAIASRLKSRALSMGQAMKNVSDGVSIAQVADGALGQMSDILQSVRTQVVQAANDSQSLESRQAIQSEINGSLTALNEIAQSTSFNGQPLLSGNFVNKSFSTGQGSSIEISIDAMDVSKLGNSETGSLSGIDVTTAQGAQDALGVVDEALDQVSRVQSNIGSTQNQFTTSYEALYTGRINLEAAQSQIMDVDIAEESMVMNQMKLLEKASTFALVQANVSKGNLINLIG